MTIESKVFTELEIDQILLIQPINLQQLFLISRQKGGFLNNNLRQRIWPKLFNINRYDTRDYRQYINDKKLSDFNQIELDIERSLWNYSEISYWDDMTRQKRRHVLSNIIKAIISIHKELHYFQGFHDIVSVFLIVLQHDTLTYEMTNKISKIFFQDAMKCDFNILSKGMKIIMVILQIADIQVYEHLQKTEMEPYFCTSWIITWFAHDLKSINEIARIFDVMLCSHPLFIMYLCAAVSCVIVSISIK